MLSCCSDCARTSVKSTVRRLVGPESALMLDLTVFYCTGISAFTQQDSKLSIFNNFPLSTCVSVVKLNDDKMLVMSTYLSKYSQRNSRKAG